MTWLNRQLQSKSYFTCYWKTLSLRLPRRKMEETLLCYSISHSSSLLLIRANYPATVSRELSVAFYPKYSYSWTRMRFYSTMKYSASSKKASHLARSSVLNEWSRYGKISRLLARWSVFIAIDQDSAFRKIAQELNLCLLQKSLFVQCRSGSLLLWELYVPVCVERSSIWEIQCSLRIIHQVSEAFLAKFHFHINCGVTTHLKSGSSWDRKEHVKIVMKATKFDWVPKRACVLFQKTTIEKNSLQYSSVTGVILNSVLME